MPPADPAAVEAALKRVREYHQFGVTARENVRMAAAARGVAVVKAEQARRFARAYDEAALDRLLAECREHRYPLGPSLAGRLVAVPAADRPGFEADMAAGGWTYAELEREIKSRFRLGVARPGGRKTRVGATPAAVLGTLGRECRRWEGLVSAVAAGSAALPADVRVALAGASGAVELLHKVVTAAVASAARAGD